MLRTAHCQRWMANEARMTRNYIWSQVQIEPEVRWFSRLSPEDVDELTLEIKCARNPAVKLSQIISERGRAGRDGYRKRNADDARKIRNPDR